MNLRASVLALLLPSAITIAQTQEVIPRQLAAALEKHGCKEIVNYSDFQNLHGRWWISLKDFTGSDTDFAFYCHDKTDRMATRFIVKAKGDRSPWKACRSTIEQWRGQVRPQLLNSLEVVTVSSRYSRISDLGRWWLADSSRNTNFIYGPKGTKVPDFIIDTICQGSGGLYACHQGKSYTIGLD